MRQYWRVQQLNWTAPVTNKLLLDLGFGYPSSLYGKLPEPEDLRLTQVNEQAGLIRLGKRRSLPEPPLQRLQCRPADRHDAALLALAHEISSGWW